MVTTVTVLNVHDFLDHDHYTSNHSGCKSSSGCTPGVRITKFSKTFVSLLEIDYQKSLGDPSQQSGVRIAVTMIVQIQVERLEPKNSKIF